MPIRKYQRKKLHGGSLAGDLLSKLLLEAPQLIGRALAEPASAVGQKIAKWVRGEGALRGRAVGMGYREPHGGGVGALTISPSTTAGSGFRAPGEPKKTRQKMMRFS